MRSLIAIAAILIACTNVQAQSTARATDSTRSEMIVRERQPVLIDTLSNVLEYPEMAKRAGIEGKVTIRALIGRDGQVWKMEILKSSNSIFEKPATKTIQKLHYLPALKNGEPVQAWIEQEIIYKL
jgi:periplasmic protein TonB